MSRARPGVRPAVLLLLLLLALGAALWSLADQWAGVRDAVSQLSVAPVAGAAAAALLSLVLSLLTWRSTLAGLGTRVPLRAAARIFFVGQLGKYLPGSVWPVLAQMELGASYGLSRRQVGTASLLAVGIGVPGALLIGALALPALFSGGAAAFALVFLALPVTGALLHPRVLNPLLDRGFRLLRRPPLPRRLSAAAIARVALLSAAAQLLLGLQAYLLAVDLGAHGARVLPIVVGAFTLATVAGLLALPVPAGAGVREAVLVAALSPVLPVSRAILLAVISRILLTAADVTVATGGMVGSRRFVGKKEASGGATTESHRRPMR
jgi:uncharacterized membrane protein YbhN (UPF0104 family)